MRLVIDGQRLTARRTGVGRCLESLLADWAETGWPLAETLLVAPRPRAAWRGCPTSPGLTTVVVGEGWPGLAWETLRPRPGPPARRPPVRPGQPRPARPGAGRRWLILYDTLPWSVPESFPWHVRSGSAGVTAWPRAGRPGCSSPRVATARDVARVHGVPDDRLRVVYPGPEPRFRPLPARRPRGRARRGGGRAGRRPVLPLRRQAVAAAERPGGPRRLRARTGPGSPATAWSSSGPDGGDAAARPGVRGRRRRPRRRGDPPRACSPTRWPCSTRRTTRGSACRSSRRWRAAARS